MTMLTVAWVAISGLGLILSLYLTIQSWLDIVELTRNPNGRDEYLIARSRFAREGIRVTVHWSWLLLGISILLGVNVGVLFIMALLHGNLALTMNSLIDARTRALIHRRTNRAETEIERQDREVGDERRMRQEQDGI